MPPPTAPSSPTTEVPSPSLESSVSHRQLTHEFL
ncbi:hypothetical protein LAZ67_15002278 [Cordylochernes scorpioides]|uniref:Uncharacterized protein n=1 Tax=Cordylochernes scorpioides TaxID=51811 RepID=A0ABY6LE96_9ARAC|nr:hypothetical protein LAZ67_15002278 [Cordylochernes scorpioides]